MTSLTNAELADQLPAASKAEDRRRFRDITGANTGREQSASQHQ